METGWLKPAHICVRSLTYFIKEEQIGQFMPEAAQLLCPGTTEDACVQTQPCYLLTCVFRQQHEVVLANFSAEMMGASTRQSKCLCQSRRSAQQQLDSVPLKESVRLAIKIGIAHSLKFTQKSVLWLML